MALYDLERKKVENAAKAFLAIKRPPPHVRPELDLGWRLTDQSIELFEIRPQWDDPKTIHEYPFAKATFARTKNHWRIFWMRSDLKWHGYEPVPFAKTIDQFMLVVAQDEYHCFFG